MPLVLVKVNGVLVFSTKLNIDSLKTNRDEHFVTGFSIIRLFSNANTVK